MSRPTKCRRVCHLPEIFEFSPCGDSSGETVILTVDEFETIRLIDKEGLSQMDCGIQLGVGRTTAQKIYESARKKIAEALVFGCTLKIDGGDVNLCNGNALFCYKKDCIKRQIKTDYKMEKGDNTMRIAVTYENGEIFQHFGHTEQFKVYDVEDGKVIESRVVSTNGQGHGALASLLSNIGADILICGGIGGGAQTALAGCGIKLYGGVSGDADAAVDALIKNCLQYNPDVKCNHHDHGHSDCHSHGEGHSCSSHVCGKDNCSER